MALKLVMPHAKSFASTILRMHTMRKFFVLLSLLLLFAGYSFQAKACHCARKNNKKMMLDSSVQCEVPIANVIFAGRVVKIKIIQTEEQKETSPIDEGALKGRDYIYIGYDKYLYIDYIIKVTDVWKGRVSDEITIRKYPSHDLSYPPACMSDYSEGEWYIIQANSIREDGTLDYADTSYCRWPIQLSNLSEEYQISRATSTVMCLDSLKKAGEFKKVITINDHFEKRLEAIKAKEVSGKEVKKGSSESAITK